MDSTARTKARLQEIEAKKARLEELRRKRELQEKEIKNSRLSVGEKTTVIAKHLLLKEHSREFLKLTYIGLDCPTEPKSRQTKRHRGFTFKHTWA